ncbi:beta strand repeat-containing protein [Algoriphagus yeomjeoni]|uniref:beta strand repeat-containing protein n=1 Tax=Algoriphagus yeomjeoni TaxID=291403 RepID=UPI003CE5772C
MLLKHFLPNFLSKFIFLSGLVWIAVSSNFSGAQTVTYNSGSGNFTVPAGVTNISVSVWGAGGGGGFNNATRPNGSPLGAIGGGGGAFILANPYPVTPGATIPYTIGTGGIGQTAGSPVPHTAGTGMPSSFGSGTSLTYLIANGGAGGRGTLGGGGGSPVTGGPYVYSNGGNSETPGNGNNSPGSGGGAAGSSSGVGADGNAGGGEGIGINGAGSGGPGGAAGASGGNGIQPGGGGGGEGGDGASGGNGGAGRIIISYIALTSATNTDAQTVCSGNSLTPITYSVPIGSTVAIPALPASGVSHTYNSGTGIVTISGTPTASISSYTINVTTNYGVTLTRTGTITLNQTPTLSSTLTPAAICSNSTFTYTPTSATSGATYTWTRAAVTGISNAAVTTAQSSSPNETLVNTTANPVNVVYAYTITANGCSNTQNVIVTVNPATTLSSTLTPAAICSNSAFTYTPTSSTGSATFTWTRAAVSGISNAAVSTAQASNPNETLINTTTNPVNVVYAYTITANGCSNTQNVTVTVNPTPTLSSTLTPAAICTNTAFTYTPTSATVGATFTWTRAAVTGISNAAVTTAQASNPNETLINTTANPVNVVYAYTITANGCSNTQNVTVLVRPTPSLFSTLTPAAICSNSTFTYTPTSATSGATYTWTRAAVTGISNAAVTSAQASNPNETLINTTANPVNVVYAYTITANGCSNTQNVTVAVKPTPTLSSTLTPAAICSNSAFTYTPTSATVGATFTWTRAAVSGISNAAVTTAQTSNPNETLINTTANPVNVVYAYTITANGCSNTQNVAVVVNPSPTLSSTLTPAAICTNTAFTYTPTSAAVGATFTWTRAAVSGISNAAVTTAQVSNPNETLINTTANPVNVVYTYTITANGCSNTQNVTVVVNPSPTLSSILTPAAICSNSTFTYTPTSATSGATYTWTRSAVTGISNAAVTTAQSANPNETLINTTANPVNVVYAYTITANGCSNTQNVTVAVKPTPTLSSTLTPAAICSNSAFTYTPTSSTVGATFTWTRAAVAGISNAAVTTAQASNPNETLINTTANPVNVVYAYTTTANGCSNTQNVTITVNPTPTLSSSLSLATCNNAAFTYTPTSATTGVTFTWTRAAVSGISNAAVTTAQTSNPNETLINTTANPVNVVYAYTITANGCTNTQNVTVTVDPTTVITTQPDNSDRVECFGDGFNPLSVTAEGANLSYQWYSNPTQSNSGGTAVPGATNSTFTPSSTVEGIEYYYVIVTGNCGIVISDPSGQFRVNPPITVIDDNPNTTPQTQCLGGSYVGAELTVLASGEGTVTYQWYKNTSASNSGGTEISGATSANYLPLADEEGTHYYYAVASSNCGTVPSDISGAYVTTALTEIDSESLAGQIICENDSFTPISIVADGTAPITYQWYRNDQNSLSIGNIAPVGTNSDTYTPTADLGTYYYFVEVSSACGTNVTSSVSGAFIVNPIPDVSNTILSQTICSGGSTTEVILTSGVAGATFTWTASATAGVSGFSASGSGPIPIETISTTGTTQGTVTYVITPSANGCPGPTKNYTVLVNPQPTVTNSTLTQTICSGGSTTAVTPTSGVAGTTFTWTASATPGVSGFTTSGNGPIPVQTISTTGTTRGTVTYVITPTANGCPGPTTNYTVSVDPRPTVTNTPLTQTICSGASTTLVTLTSGVAGATFAWTASATPGVSGFTTSGNGPIPVQTISTTGTTRGTVTYVITPTANGCPGPTTNYTVLVDPRPIVTNTTLTQTICSGASTTLVTPTSNVAGTTFAWTATATAGVSGFTTSGNGPIPVQTISTTGTTQGTVTYVITPTANSCPGTPTNYTVLVNPRPTVTNTPLTQTICSGASTTLVTPTSGVSGTTFAWTASATAGVSGFTASGNGPIPVQTISTTGTTQGTVTYAITPTANGCTGPTTNYTVLVNPLATVGPPSIAFPSVCISSPALTPFTQTTSGVTGIDQSGVAGVNGLPPGIKADFSGNTITFSGTATTTGLYTYNIPVTTGTCVTGLAVTGTIDVTPEYDITAVSSVSATSIGGAATVTFYADPTKMLNGTYKITYQIKQASGAFTTVGPVDATVVNGKGTFTTTPINSNVDTYTVQILTIKKSTDVCTVTLPNPPTTYFGVCSAVFGGNSTFFVPAGVYSITIEVYGGGGGGNSFGGGGGGYSIRQNIPVVPGEPLGVFVAGITPQNTNGGSSYVTRDSSLPNPTTNSLVYATGGTRGETNNSPGGIFDPRYSGSNGSISTGNNGGNGGGPLGGLGGVNRQNGRSPGGGGSRAQGQDGTGGGGLVIISYSCPDADITDCIKVIDDGSKSGTTVLEFTCNYTWIAPEGLTEFTTYVGSGGGGGGSGEGSGGGGSGSIIRQTFTVTNPYGLPAGTDYGITVGQGGAGASGINANGSPGQASTFTGSINGSPVNISVPGGGGGGSQSTNAGGSGASGGGGGASPNPSQTFGVGGSVQLITYTGTNVTVYQGNVGGSGDYSAPQNSVAGGGGGGLIPWGNGNDGQNGKAAGNGQGEGGRGGDGRVISLGDSTRNFGAGGGGIGRYFNGTDKIGLGGSAGGIRIGGSGNLSGVNPIGGAGTNKTGSGGGAGYFGGGRGGNGVVYITFFNFRILEVEYLYFNAVFNPENRSGELTWATAQEWENDRFEIERATNGDLTSWTKIGEVKGQGYKETPTEYNFEDTELPAAGGNIFYRLKQIDADGSFSYSVTRSIQVKGLKGQSTWIVYPNPSSPGNYVTLDLLDRSSYRDEQILVRIANVTGAFDSYSVRTIQDVSTTVNNYLEKAAPGIHIVQLIWGEHSEQLKIIRR